MAIPHLSIKIKLFVGIAVLSVASLFYLFVQTRPSPPELPPTFKNLQIGSDTKKDVLEKLGDPLFSTFSATGTEQLNYQSNNSYWPHQVYIQTKDQKDILVKERLLNTVQNELQKYISKYGSPEAVLASNDKLPALGFRLHVFTAAGVAINANPDTGVVFEIWYFPPMTLAKFQTQYTSEITTWTQPQTF